MLGYIGLKRFRKTEAKSSTETTNEHAAVAKKLVDEIREKRDEGERIIRNLTAQTATDDPEEAKQARAWVSSDYLGGGKTPKDALFAYDQAIRLKPDHAEAYNNRGAAKGWLGRYDDALADCDQAIRLKPDYAEAYNNRGNAKAELGRRDDALADYDEAIRLKPNHAEAYNNRGAAKGRAGAT